jgi:hypothetical protein
MVNVGHCFKATKRVRALSSERAVVPTATVVRAIPSVRVKTVNQGRVQASG